MRRLIREILDPRLRWWDACFADPAEEAAFRAAPGNTLRISVRIYLATALALYTAFTPVDILFGGAMRGDLYAIRFAICVLLGLLLLINLRPIPVALVPLLAGAGVLVVAGGIMALAVKAPPDLQLGYNIGLPVAIMAAYVLLRLTPIELTILGFVQAVAGNLVWLIAGLGHIEYLVMLNFYMAAALVVGLLASYMIQLYRRIGYAERQRVESQAKALREALAESAVAHAEAERAARVKAAFIQQMSHELRTPLNAVIGFGQVMRDQLFGSIGNERYLEYARDIHDSAKHLLGIINNIIDLSRLESGTLEVNMTAVDAAQVLREAQVLVRGQAEARGIRIEFAAAPALPRVDADPRALRQIAVNLLGNAIKYSPANSVVKVQADEEGDQVLLLFIDSGPGMSAEELERALTPFGGGMGLASSQNGEAGGEGPGLGLPLALKLAELQGGSLKIDTAPGRGLRAALRLQRY